MGARAAAGLRRHRAHEGPSALADRRARRLCARHGGGRARLPAQYTIHLECATALGIDWFQKAVLAQLRFNLESDSRQDAGVASVVRGTAKKVPAQAAVRTHQFVHPEEGSS